MVEVQRALRLRKLYEIGTEPTKGASRPAMIPPSTIKTSRSTKITATVTSNPKKSFESMLKPFGAR